MGQEATCAVTWAGQSGQGKVLLEAQELILRGSGTLARRSVSIASLTEIEVSGDRLKFRAGPDPVSLTLGARQAQTWAKKLTSPPPTLAAKLGIGRETQLALLGNLDTAELIAASAQAASTESSRPNLVLAFVKTAADLNYVLDVYGTFPTHPPIWVVYPKGKSGKVGETEVRTTLRQAGLIDTKIASVSATLTALRFQSRL